jgi:hypothetical protein
MFSRNSIPLLIALLVGLCSGLVAGPLGCGSKGSPAAPELPSGDTGSDVSRPDDGAIHPDASPDLGNDVALHPDDSPDPGLDVPALDPGFDSGMDPGTDPAGPEDILADVPTLTDGMDVPEDLAEPDSTDADADGSDAPDTNPGPATLHGSVQKGPFVVGSTVTVSVLDTSLNPTGQVFLTQTKSDLGDFELTFDHLGLVALEGNGYYYNEVSGQLSTSLLTLRAFYEVTSGGEQAAYINIFTHLVYNRVKKLLTTTALSPAEAVSKAETELIAALEIGPPGLDPAAQGIQMNVYGGHTFANAYLLAVSSVLGRAAQMKGGPLDAALQELINTMSLDFADDGNLSKETRATLYEAALSMDTGKIEADLAKRLSTLSSTATVPDQDVILDDDRDGKANIADCLPYDPLRWSGHSDLDADGQDSIRCGGTDPDDDCPTCGAGKPVACGDARDHDGDGVVDDRNACGAGAHGTPSLKARLAGKALDVAARGHHVFVLGPDSLTVVDAGTPSKPAAVATLSGAFSGASRLYLRGDRALVATPSAVVLVDTSDPKAPARLGETRMAVTGGLGPVGAKALAIGPGLAYLLGSGEVEGVVDVSNPLLALALGPMAGTPPDSPPGDGLVHDGRLLVVSDGLFRRFDLGIPAVPQLAAEIPLIVIGEAIDSSGCPEGNPECIPGGAELPAKAPRIVAAGGRAYVASDLGLFVVDLPDEGAPSIAGRLGQGTIQDIVFTGVVLAGSTVYLSGHVGLVGVDVSQPAMPAITAGPVAGVPPSSALALSGGLAFLAAGDEGLVIVDLDVGGTPSRPCGNGVREPALGETCDGKDLDATTCGSLGYGTSTARPPCRENCTPDASWCDGYTLCGNGKADDGEQCDGKDLKGGKCSSLGFVGGTLACSPECQYEPAGCHMCGDGKRQEGEECEPGAFAVKPDTKCENLGFLNGILRCTADCRFDRSRCTNCGNGKRDAGEDCEGKDLGGKTDCKALGYVQSAALSCGLDCRYDVSKCTAVCGNGAREPGEECDGKDLGGVSGCKSLGYVADGAVTCTDLCRLSVESCVSSCGNDVLEPGEECEPGDTHSVTTTCIAAGYPDAPEDSRTPDVVIKSARFFSTIESDICQ